MEIENTINIILDKLETWSTAFLTNLPNILIAVFVMVAFYFIARYAKKYSRKLLSKIVSNPAVIKLGGTVVFIALAAIGLIIALNILNLSKTVTSLLAGAGVVGLALSFAFQDVAANFISGLFLTIRRPIKKGDQIKTNGLHGIVQDISFRSTTIETFQGQTLTVPNRMIFENPIENISANGRRRIDLEVGVSYSSDLGHVRDVAENCLKGLESVEQSKPVKVIFTGFGGSSINFKLMYWCCVNTEPGYLQALNDGVMAVKKAFDKEDINIPFPIRTLQFDPKSQEKLASVVEEIGMN